MSNEDMNFEQFYIVTGNLFPDIQFAQYNAAHDEVQVGFIMLAGLAEPDLPWLLADNLADIKAGLQQDNFHSFTAGGSGHCVTVTPEAVHHRQQRCPLDRLGDGPREGRAGGRCRLRGLQRSRASRGRRISSHFRRISAPCV
ncbi:MAG: hypothetical protein HND48_13490 [Chloroflexi bacterium]|nr:hypothetical protein [Chloroflexota bacterium]